MKRVTSAERLAALLGITDKVDTSVYEEDPKARKKLQKKLQKKQGKGPQGVTEEEIQKFRAAQGVVYFLQAPELFTMKNCKHCKVPFLVSRKQVSHCSYTCIAKDLESLGIKWSREGKYEELAQDTSVYDKNEPIWITGEVLERVRAVLNSEPELV